MAAQYRIGTEWTRGGAPFERGNYARDHLIRFAGGQTLKGSSATAFGGNDASANPEELLLSALSTCHMLTFLAVAVNRGYVVESYRDDAVAVVDKNADGKMAVVKATLAPHVTFSGDKQPAADEYAKLHERAHAACFIANSVRTEVEVKPSSP